MVVRLCHEMQIHLCIFDNSIKFLTTTGNSNFTIFCKNAHRMISQER